MKRKAAKFVGKNLLCGDCNLKLEVAFDTQDDFGEGHCWCCPHCGEWFTISGEPSISGTSVPDKGEQNGH